MPIAAGAAAAPARGAAAQPHRLRSRARPATRRVRIGPFRPDPSLVATRHSRARGRACARQRGGARGRGGALHSAGRRAAGGDAGAHAAGGGFPARGAAAAAGAAGSAAGAEEERRPRGLLARLASGLTRRDEDDAERAAPEPATRSTEASRASSAAARRAAASGGHAGLRIRQAGAAAPHGRGGGAAGSLDPRGRADPDRTEPRRSAGDPGVPAPPVELSAPPSTRSGPAR